MNRGHHQDPGGASGTLHREFPERPIVGVGGVVIDANRVLLVRRGSKPLQGEWSIPGGVVELGETLQGAVVRELKEETGLDVKPVGLLAVADRITWGHRTRRVRYHYVLVDYACRKTGGTLAPATDVIDVRWVREHEVTRYGLARFSVALISRAFRYLRK